MLGSTAVYPQEFRGHMESVGLWQALNRQRRLQNDYFIKAEVQLFFQILKWASSGEGEVASLTDEQTGWRYRC